ncbi:hypothetical protein HYU20_01245 [Candidatus Woesearchaeota archaeon]|nr:hypothetical protein [Candidatus Woesearchaeota archaeon]
MKSSVFVRIDRYRELYGVIRQIRAKLDDAKQVLKKIKDTKSQEDGELESWEKELATVEQKLSDISGAMTER